MAAVVCQDYEASLEDLKINSKPLINMLTMLADENKEHAVHIVRLIEKRMQKVARSCQKY